jgi:hypothetical protein
MAVYRKFLDGSGELQIDVDTSGGAAGISIGGGYVAELLATLEALALRVGEHVVDLPEKKRPSELVLAFDLTGLDGGGFAISRSSENANFHVSFRWNLEQRSTEVLESLPTLPGVGPEQL